MKMTSKTYLTLLLTLISTFSLLSRGVSQDMTPKVLELLEKRCQNCHHPDTNDDFPYLHKEITVEDLISDEAVIPGKPEESPLFSRISLEADSRKRMPKSRGAKGDESYSDVLSAEETKMISDWIVALGNAPAKPVEPVESPVPTKRNPPEGKPGDAPKGPTVVAAAKITPAERKIIDNVVPVEDVRREDVLPSGVSLEEKVHWIFKQRCSGCHSGDYDPELHGTVNLAQLFSEKDTSGSNSLASLIVDRVVRSHDDSDRMPKSRGKEGDKGYRPPLVEAEMTALRKWIEADPPVAVQREIISNDDMIDAMYSDLDKTSENERRFVRYFTLTNLYNAKDEKGNSTISDLDPHYAGVSKLINSLSLNAKITRPKAIDEEETVYRIDLRDYNWKAEDWERMIKYYPYGMYGIDSRKENLMEKYTGCRMSYVRGDWFVFACSQPPLYDEMLYTLLDCYDPSMDTDIVKPLEDRLGFDRNHNLREGEAIRAGFQFSGVSQANRLVERHEIGSWPGGYWISYDFTPLSADRTQDLQMAPLGPPTAELTHNEDHMFKHDGGEMVFSLPNGMQGYMLAAASGKRLNRGPVEIVQDKSRADGVIINGISCISCHDSGIKPSSKVLDKKAQTLAGMKDEMRPLVEASGILDFKERKLMEKLYVEPEILRAKVKEDYDRFAAANDLAIKDLAETTEPVRGLYDHFKAPVTARRLASEFGMSYEELIKQLDEESDQSETLAVISSSLARDLPVRRENMLREYISVVYALGYELMSFTPLGYEDFGGEKYADLISNSEQYLGAFGNADYTTAEVKHAVLTSDHAAESLATESVLLKHGGKLKVSIQPTLHVGERAKLGIVATADTHIRVFHFSSDKHVTELFPGTLGKSTLRPKNKKLEVSWETTKPAGAEHVIVYASKAAIKNVAKGEKVGDFTVYDKGVVFSTRGIPKAIKADEVKEGTSVPAPITEAKIGYLLKD